MQYVMEPNIQKKHLYHIIIIYPFTPSSHKKNQHRNTNENEHYKLTTEILFEQIY